MSLSQSSQSTPIILGASGPIEAMSKPHGAKSWVWEHFSVYNPTLHPEKIEMAKCDKCEEDVKYCGSSGKLIRHIKRHHNDIFRVYETKKEKIDQISKGALDGWVKKKKKNEILNTLLKWIIKTSMRREIWGLDATSMKLSGKLLR